MNDKKKLEAIDRLVSDLDITLKYHPNRDHMLPDRNPISVKELDKFFLFWMRDFIRILNANEISFKESFHYNRDVTIPAFQLNAVGYHKRIMPDKVKLERIGWKAIEMRLTTLQDKLCKDILKILEK